jgi:hypothetical protein
MTDRTAEVESGRWVLLCVVKRAIQIDLSPQVPPIGG